MDREGIFFKINQIYFSKVFGIHHTVPPELKDIRFNLSSKQLNENISGLIQYVEE